MGVTTAINQAEPIEKAYFENGAYMVQATIFRKKVINFQFPHGETVRVLPEYAFTEENLQQLNRLPVTFAHPKDAEKENFVLTQEDVHKFEVGTLCNVRAVGTDVQYLTGEMRIRNSEIIDYLQNHKNCQVSLGWFMEMEKAPGVYRSEPYDFIMHIKHMNHLAILPRPRVGTMGEDAIVCNEEKKKSRRLKS